MLYIMLYSFHAYISLYFTVALMYQCYNVNLLHRLCLIKGKLKMKLGRFIDRDDVIDVHAKLTVFTDFIVITVKLVEDPDIYEDSYISTSDIKLDYPIDMKYELQIAGTGNKSFREILEDEWLDFVSSLIDDYISSIVPLAILDKFYHLFVYEFIHCKTKKQINSLLYQFNALLSE